VDSASRLSLSGDETSATTEALNFWASFGNLFPAALLPDDHPPLAMADRTDPHTFTRKERAPEFDIAEARTDWPFWKLKWTAFLDSSGIERLTEGDGNQGTKDARNAAIRKHKYTALIQAFSVASLRTLQSLTLADRENADAIITAMDRSINAGTGILAHRHELHTRLRAHESVETFAVSLKDLALKCGYSDCCFDQMARDAFVSTVNDRDITEKLLQQPTAMTFAEAVDFARAMEGAKLFASSLAQPHGGATVARFQQQQQRSARRDNKPGGCGNCGGNKHASMDQCPARGKVCRNCHRENHFDNVCRSTDGDGQHKETRRHTATLQTPGPADSSDDEEQVNHMQLLSFMARPTSQVNSTCAGRRPDA
jgi:hypothetical protein